RFIVMEEVYDEFVERLKDHFSRLKPGDPLDPKITLALINPKKEREECKKQEDKAIPAGAKVVYEKEGNDLEGEFFMPTILTEIDRDNPVHTTELFGPVAVVYKVTSEEEAIELANDSPYGLGGIVFAGDANHGAEIAAKIETGMVFVNNIRYS